MTQSAASTAPIWALPAGTVASLIALSFALTVYSPYAVFPILLFLAPAFVLALIMLALVAIIHKKPRLRAAVALSLIGVIATSLLMVNFQEPIRESLRWLIWSNRFKAELWATSAPKSAGLRHMEWEATGFAGVANNTIYLVFDPTDALNTGTQTGEPGKYAGLPCEVLRVRRLETHWYSVRFYTDEAWGERNNLDCTGHAQ